MGSTGWPNNGSHAVGFSSAEISVQMMSIDSLNYHPQAVDRLVERVISARTEDSTDDIALYYPSSRTWSSMMATVKICSFC